MRLAIVVGLWLVGLAGCSDNSEPVKTTRGVTDDEIVLGTYTDVSGPVAIWGKGVVRGARMRFEEANEAGGVHGRRIRFVVEDTSYQVPKAIQAANKLINRDNVLALLLALGTPTNNAVMSQQFEQGVPNLFPVSGARAMIEPPHPLKFTQRGIYYDEMRAAVKFFVERRDKEAVCAIYHDTDFGLEIREAVEDQTRAMGMQIVGEAAHKPTESEFTAAVLKLRNAGCDLVLMGTVHRDTILVLDTARKMGWTDVAWVGNNAAYGQVIANQDSGEGYFAFVHMARIYPDDEKSPAVQAWWDRYHNLWDVAPGLPAMEGYRGADLVVRALEKAGPNLDVVSLVHSIESITDYTDIFGYKVSFSPEKHSGTTESVLSQVQNGRWVVLERDLSY